MICRPCAQASISLLQDAAYEAYMQYTCIIYFSAAYCAIVINFSSKKYLEAAKRVGRCGVSEYTLCQGPSTIPKMRVSSESSSVWANTQPRRRTGCFFVQH